MGKTKLNLGCGNDYKKDFLNLDIFSTKADIKWDLEKFPYPFKKNTFEEVLMKSVLEHLSNPKKALEEIYRISKPRAKIYIRVPHFSSIHAWGDIEHKRGYSIRTFTKENLSDKFEMIKQHIEISPSKFFIRPLAKKFQFYMKSILHIFLLRMI